ncbi:MAG: GNAT family N-acetyltransferase [Paracoccaceae bacterium]|nr:GNAT family N-acetyltransferase [Paracoccaceae bacterium]MDG2258288.1 GNAT family N-acetyltransferase [Paracoccaceae bacterium]
MNLLIERSDDLDACLAIRFTVFVEEQSVPIEEERDHYDQNAIHILATQQGTPVGTARIVVADDIGKIGRVAVLASHRGTGLGAKLIHACLAELRAQSDVTKAKLGSQTHALGFYEKLGFVAQGPEFDDAGIPHRMMSLSL